MQKFTTILLWGIFLISLSGMFSIYAAEEGMTSESSDAIDVHVDGTVLTQVLQDDTLYIVGSFTKVNVENAAYVDRTNVAAIDIPTRTVLPWNPAFNDTVYDALIYQGNLYVGGAFTQVDGMNRTYMASFTLPDRKLSPWSPEVDKPVHEMLLQGKQLVVKTKNDEEETPDTSQEGQEVVIINQATPIPSIYPTESTTAGLMINTKELGFQIPSLSDILTFTIRIFFVITGIAALFFMLIGAFSWVTSGGDKDAVTAAREKIQSAVIGLLMVVVVLAIVWTIEQVIFKKRICLGVSCPLTIPSLIQPN